MKELIILVLCFVLYVVAVEMFEAKESVSRQGLLVQQEQSFSAPSSSSPLVSSDGASAITFDTAEGN
jgi:hypothetical protein